MGIIADDKDYNSSVRLLVAKLNINRIDEMERYFEYILNIKIANLSKHGIGVSFTFTRGVNRDPMSCTPTSTSTFISK